MYKKILTRMLRDYQQKGDGIDFTPCNYCDAYEAINCHSEVGCPFNFDESDNKALNKLIAELEE